MSGRISFIGAGPGAADLITVRGAQRLAEADVVIWSSSAVAAECVQEHVRADVELLDASQLTHEQALELYRRAERDHANVVRVHSGDPALWSSVQAQYEACSRMRLEVEIVPGVTEFTAAAATVGRELTSEGTTSVLIGKFDGQSSLLESSSVREFVDNGTTMALSLSAARVGQLVEELRAGGHAEDVPVLVAYKVSWPDELVLRTTLAELEATVKHYKLWRNVYFFIGHALDAAGPRARPYSHGPISTRWRSGAAGRFSSSDESRRGRSADEPASSHSIGEQLGGDDRMARADQAVSGESAEAGEPAATLLPTPRVTDSDLAWWAVRDWQEATRNPRKIPVQASETDQGQSELVAVDESAGTDEQVDEPTVKRTRSRASTATSRSKTTKSTTKNAASTSKNSATSKANGAAKRKTAKRDQPEE